MAKKRTLQQQPFKGKTAIICGGSKGIGKETAKELIKLGGSVLILARGQRALDDTYQELISMTRDDDQFVERVACDATNLEELKPQLEKFVNRHGVPDYLINMVGYAYPEYIQNLALDDFKRNMNANYYGQLVPAIILLPYFMKENRGHITFTSSVLGFMGLMGYAAYAPTKYALVGLVEVLRHELKPYNIGFSLLYPPDTDTPGFETENKTKPQETALLSETAKLYPPEIVAEHFVAGLVKKRLNIFIGEGKFINLAMRVFPGAVRFFIDTDLKKIRKKLGNP